METSTDRIDTSGKALVEFWKTRAERGDMNANTAGAIRAACSQVLAVEKDWQTLDVTKINVNDITRRFENKRHDDFKAASLATYKKRFTQGLADYLNYVKEPSAWKAPSLERRGRKPKAKVATNGKPETATSVAAEHPVTVEHPKAATLHNGLTEYPFPLRDGRFVYLHLPADLKKPEVARLTAFLNTLAVDSGAVTA